jgi:hypothetical protein
VEAGIALLQGDDLLDPAIIGKSEGSSPAGAVMVKAAARLSLLSVEAVAPEERTMARARYRLDLAPIPQMGIAMSDLLLLQGGDAPVDSLADAVPIARGSSRVPPGELLRVYWEIHGLNPAISPEVTMSFTLRKPEAGALGGALRWLGETIGILGEAVPLRTEWVEEVEPGPWMGRSLSFRIPDVS